MVPTQTNPRRGPVPPNSQNHSAHNVGGHTPSSQTDRRALVAAGWLTGTYFFIELAVGFYSGSVAVVSDAFHTFSAVEVRRQGVLDVTSAPFESQVSPQGRR